MIFWIFVNFRTQIRIHELKKCSDPFPLGGSAPADHGSSLHRPHTRLRELELIRGII